MTFAFPQITVGGPVTHKALTVFPLVHGHDILVEYRLSDEALSVAGVVVREVGEQGSVPELIVDNGTDARILFLEGEELRGAKQNRILNTTVMVPARSQTRIPVSCVERGRWRYTSKHFSSGLTMSPSKLHYTMKCSVADSLTRKVGHRSDQSGVWMQVDRLTAASGVSSPTSAMSDTYDNLAEKMIEYQEKLAYCEGASGVAVALGDKVQSCDLFDKAATCRKAWPRILSGYVLDALLGAAAGSVEPETVETFLVESARAPWRDVQTIGEGQEYRAEFNKAQGSALMLADALIHVNVLQGD